MDHLTTFTEKLLHDRKILIITHFSIFLLHKTNEFIVDSQNIIDPLLIVGGYPLPQPQPQRQPPCQRDQGDRQEGVPPEALREQPDQRI
jgi:hypothetical protein